MIKSVILYFQFFTAIPLPFNIDKPVERFQKGIVWFSLAALIYSAVMGLLFLVFNSFFSSYVTLVYILLSDVALTNGFHYDALADTADGILSGKDRENMLKIMKDSRIGTHGVLALIFYFLLFIFLGFEMLSKVGTTTDQILAVMNLFIIGRGALCYSFHHYKYHSHTKNGLGAILTGISNKRIALTQLIFFALVGLFGGVNGMFIYLLVIIFTEIYRQYIMRKIDGLNGDTTGVICLMSQVVYLLIINIIL